MGSAPAVTWTLGRSAQAHDVLGRGALLALHHVELHALALGERLEARALDGRVVDEAVLLTVVTRDEAEALRVVEPLHGTGRTHCRTPRICSRCNRSPARPYVPTASVLVIPALTVGSARDGSGNDAKDPRRRRSLGRNWSPPRGGAVAHLS